MAKGILIVLFGLLLAYYLYTNYGGGVGIKLSSYVYSTGVIFLLFNPLIQSLYKNNRITSVVEYCGKISFGIYLIHRYVIIFVSKFFSISSWFCLWLVVICLTGLAIFYSRKIFSKHVNKYLGFS